MTTNPLITEARRLFDDFPQGLSVCALKSAKKWLVIQASDNGVDFNFIAECDDEELADGIAFAANSILAFADKIEELERHIEMFKDAIDKHDSEIEEQEKEITVAIDASVFFRNKATDLQVLRDTDQREIAQLREACEAIPDLLDALGYTHDAEQLRKALEPK